MRVPWHSIVAVIFSSGIFSVNAALKVSTNFEGGSAKILAVNAEAQEVHISPGGDPKRGMPNWWFVRLDDVDTNKPVVLEVIAREEAVPGSDDPEKPLAAGWALPNCAAFSTDGTVWQQTAPGGRDGGRTSYRVNAGSPTVWLAWGPPFTPQDATTFVEKNARDHSFARAFLLSWSREGRSVPALEIAEGDRPATNRPAVWINAREHAWECGGSWVAVGFTEWLVSDDAAAKWLRQNAQIFLVPVLDVDHVATGDGGKYALPQDHIRDWSAQPHWPEVAAEEKRILALGKEKRMALFFDLHNGSPGQKLESFYLPRPPYVDEETAELQDRFFVCVRQAFGEIKLMDGIPANLERLPIWKQNASPWIREQCGPRTLAFTVETPWNTRESTMEGYREIGRKLGLAAERYLHEFLEHHPGEPSR
jgi:hypothetical protein